MTSPIRSQAQHAMMTRAASDADYAKRRSIDQATAQSLLDQHVAAGEPKLPERVEVDAAASLRTDSKPKAFKLLGM